MFEDLTDNINQQSLYKFAGRTDDVCTFELIEGIDSFNRYGASLTVELVYSQEERRLLEQDNNALDGKPFVRVKALLLVDEDRKQELFMVGIPLRDISYVTTFHNTPENNMFTSQEKRSLNVLEIPIKDSKGVDEIGWWYGFLCRRKEEGAILMPEWEADYLACKSLSIDTLTEEEKAQSINSIVLYHRLRWKAELGIINKEEKVTLAQLGRERTSKRLVILKDELQRVGIPINKFRKHYKQQAVFIFKRLLSFNDKSLSATGKFPIYMDFRSYIHIYIRHVEDVNMGDQLAMKDKFQLYGSDVLRVIKHVIHELNDEYQKFRENYPIKDFIKNRNDAVYFKGDYYELRIDTSGRLVTFYKASRNPLENK